MGHARIDEAQGPRVSPISEPHLSPAVSRTMSRLQDSGVLSSTTAVRIWAHRSAIAVAWLNLMETFYIGSTLEERLRELIRLRIAAVTDCQACQLSRKSDTVTMEDIACIVEDDPRFSPAERAAMDFVARLAGDHDTISDQTLKAREAAFTTEQIVEINMLAALMMAGGRMTHAQQAY